MVKINTNINKGLAKDARALKARKISPTSLRPEDPRPGLLAEGQLNGKFPGAWRHPQAWVPKELAFYFFLAPFFFWPIAVVGFIYQIYSYNISGRALEDIKNYTMPTVSFIFASDNTLMAEIFNEHRLITPLIKIPPMVIDAFIAAEDSSFYQHQGVDTLGIVRALLANIKAGQTVQGASTITQQMIRSFLLTNEKTYDRKLREMILAWQAERHMSKDEILFLYLNRIYLGRGAYGVESAARMYFGKTIQEVNLAEAAMLAGLAQAPGRLQAHLGTERSRERQNYALTQMVKGGYITQAQADRAAATELKFITRRPNVYRQVAPQYAEVVRIQMSEYMGAESLLNDGFRIYTSIDLQAQAQATAAVREGLDALALRQRMSPKVRTLNPQQVADYLKRSKSSMDNRPLMINQEPAGLVTEVVRSPSAGYIIEIGYEKGFLPAKNTRGFAFKPNDLIMVRILGRDEQSGLLELTAAPPPEIQGALVLMENKTGRVLAMVGGRDFGLEGVGNSDFNRAILAMRQPGSSFKPFVYTAALDNGYTEASVVYDVPVSYPDGPGRRWAPRNAGGGHHGPITIRDAIRRSVNVVAVKVTDSIGPDTVVEYAKRMGITTALNPSLPLALGASEVTLLDMTKAYSTFPNLGAWPWPSFVDRVEDRYGRTVMNFQPHLTQAISPQTAYIMIDMLSAVAKSGTGARVGAAFPNMSLAGKTGTTNSQADALFIGFTPEYTCGVWVGRETRISLGSGEQGARTAAPIFIAFMKQFLADKEVGKFPVPEGLVRQNLLPQDSEDIYIGSSVSYVFKADEVGRGKPDTSIAHQYDSYDSYDSESNYYSESGRGSGRSSHYTARSQEAMDRRLMDYLAGYGSGRGGI
ncbi:MAG: PBP1A family penicillin-binding protein [Deltaproteobacteria bacterium]|jgi:penicillin-binding protein 1A|nr:PBP1A family penicillin-binding protein [Deltaproteobacteria bacterium]